MDMHSTVSAMKSAKLPSQTFCETGGHTTIGDGNGERYFIMTSAEFGGAPDEVNDFAIANGNIAKRTTTWGT